MAEVDDKEPEKTEVTDADRASVQALDDDFGEQSFKESPETDNKSSGDTSDLEVKESDEKTDEEKEAAAEVAVKEAQESYDKLTPEEKGQADKDREVAELAALKAEYEKLSPEEKKRTDDIKAEIEAREVETKRVVDEHADAISKSEKRRTDTERWAQGLNQEQLELKREILILQRKAADPDYDPEADESLKKVGPTEEQKAAYSEQKGRSGASLQAAYSKYGKEATNQALAEYKELFQEDQAVQQQVMAADQPVEEAIGLVKLSKFFGKWGQDPDAIEAKMVETLTKELTPKIRETESKRIMADLKKTSSVPKGLSGVKGITNRDKKKSSSGETGAGRSMEDDFG